MCLRLRGGVGPLGNPATGVGQAVAVGGATAPAGANVGGGDAAGEALSDEATHVDRVRVEVGGGLLRTLLTHAGDDGGESRGDLAGSVLRGGGHCVTFRCVWAGLPGDLMSGTLPAVVQFVKALVEVFLFPVRCA